jgi:iron complex outermembrane recepter protein
MSSTKLQQGRAFRRAALLTAMAGSLFAYDRALAQSTGSQVAEQEQVVVTAQRKAVVDGIGVISKAAKDQSIITQDYIQTQVGSSNFAQLINLTPGFVYSSEDPTGVLSGDIRMHGFDGQHLSFTTPATTPSIRANMRWRSRSTTSR